MKYLDKSNSEPFDPSDFLKTYKGTSGYKKAYLALKHRLVRHQSLPSDLADHIAKNMIAQFILNEAIKQG